MYNTYYTCHLDEKKRDIQITYLVSNISRSTGALRPCIGSTLVNYDFVYLPKFSKIIVSL